MRRLTLTALCGTLVLAACSDQARQTPTEPTVQAPEAELKCRPPQLFPSLRVTALILKVFPAGKLRIEALARATAVAILWDTCRPAPARKAAVEFIAFMDRNTSSLKGTEEQRNTLKSLVLNGVGIPVTVSDDFGVGLFDPQNPNPTLIKTGNSQALVQLDPGAFLEPTVISISRLADAFQLTNFDGNQFPPKYDYDAVNSSGVHVLQTGKFAVVAFCLLSLEEFGEDGVYPPGGYPENRRIGHNPVGGGFEVLPEVDLVEEELADDLNCPTDIGSLAPGGSGFANAALRLANRYLAPILLPRQLWAATLGKLPPPPPIGGRAGSLSPFGVVEFSEGELQFTPGGDPVGGDFETGNILRWDCEGEFCSYPTVRLVDAEENGVAGASVTATLFRLVEGEPVEEEFVDGSTTVVQTSTGEGAGYAAFTNLVVAEPDGEFRITFSAPGATSVTSGDFMVRAF
ncbi:MAG TPA: carboxypeptidase-like regulatory domain-containing protein [Gemmatimonadales bacterium]|jgi:hypothetical protein